ncbi:aminoglycoside phosphotransferase family protein [Patescibacteria group bacterium]|nr:aminoglycoside phosphotransferase family protein [Patescibacteria group bacterium]
MNDNILTINGRTFEHVRTRDHTPVSIFKSGDLFLRKGPEKLLEEEIAFHRTLLEYDFPVPRILKEGDLDGEHYYIETSLGEKPFGEMFIEDTKNHGEISEDHFKKFLEVAEKFAKAQLATRSEYRNEESFYSGLGLQSNIEELPKLKEDTLRAFDKVKEKLKPFPYVLTHGDFNPYNILEKGVIDFGSAFHGPAGYDIIANIYHVYNFPKEDGYEKKRRFDFSERQRETYLEKMNTIYRKMGLPEPTGFANDLIFCRTIWATVRNGKIPKIQKWRYDRFGKILAAYLRDESLLELVKR